MLGFGVDQPGHYELHPSCNVNINSTDVGELTTYTIQVAECQERTYGRLTRVVSRNGEIVVSYDNLKIEGNQEVLQGNAMSVSFNRSRVMNEDEKLKYLILELVVFPKETFSSQIYRPRYEWRYTIIGSSKEDVVR